MSNTTKNISETRASREHWNEIRAKVSPGLLAKFDGGEIAVYADRAGTQRILPPIGRVVRDMSAPTSPRVGAPRS